MTRVARCFITMLNKHFVDRKITGWHFRSEFADWLLDFRFKLIRLSRTEFAKSEICWASLLAKGTNIASRNSERMDVYLCRSVRPCCLSGRAQQRNRENMVALTNTVMIFAFFKFDFGDGSWRPAKILLLAWGERSCPRALQRSTQWPWIEHPTFQLSGLPVNFFHKMLKSFGVDQPISRATVVRGSNGTRPPGKLDPCLPRNAALLRQCVGHSIALQWIKWLLLYRFGSIVRSPNW